MSSGWMKRGWLKDIWSGNRKAKDRWGGSERDGQMEWEKRLRKKEPAWRSGGEKNLQKPKQLERLREVFAG